MKNSTYSFFLLFICFILNNCTSSTNKNLENKISNNKICDLENDVYSEKATYITDFICSNVFIDNRFFTIKIVRDKFLNDSIPYKFEVENWWENESPSTLLIYDNSTCELVYSKKFEDVKLTLSKVNGEFSKEGNLYLHLISCGGGSGFTTWINRIDIYNGRIRLEQLFDSNELSVILFNKNDKDIILLNGIWDMSGWSDNLEGETHFSEHRYKIKSFKLNKNKFVLKKFGITESKFSTNNKSDYELLEEIISIEKLDLPYQNFEQFKAFDNWLGKFK